jgi:pimeloyl-ACP methyl ester carboxylesterase
VRRLVSLIGHGLLDAARALVGLTPHYLPVVGPPDTVALIATPGAMSDYLALAGPTWRNEVCARTVLEVPFNRPIQFASRLRCPILVQIADHDVVAPPEAAHAAVARARARAEVRTNPVGHFDVHAAVARARARAEVCTYPIGHFDVYAGAWQQRALADQIDFLTRHLSRNRGRAATPTGAECALARHS